MRRSTKLYTRTLAYLCLLVLVVLYARHAGQAEVGPRPTTGTGSATRWQDLVLRKKSLLPVGPVVDHTSDSSKSTGGSLTSSGPDCHGVLRPSIPKTGAWQEASPAGLYVFSAYLDRRITRHGEVKVVGVEERRHANVSLWCQLWMGSELRVVKASRTWMPEVSVKRYV